MAVPIESAVNIVQRATSLLEREERASLASAPAGVPLSASTPMPMPSPTELLSKVGSGGLPVNSSHLKADQIEARADQLRRQASDLVEGLLSLVMSPAPAPASASAQIVVRPGVAGDGADGRPYAPSVGPAAPVKAGDSAMVPVTVINDGLKTVEVSFYSSDLVGDSGFGIPARKVTFAPRSQSVQPNERRTFEVNIPVPAQTVPGVYAGVIQALAVEGLRAVLTVPVE